MKKSYFKKICSDALQTKTRVLLGLSFLTTTAFSQTYTFTSAGLTGGTGPSQAQINTAYTGSNLQGSVTVSGGIQSFTIPLTGPYRISAIGGQGGYNGGYPAFASGDFTLTAGTVLKILVGQAGTQAASGSNYTGGGGGGGSFVTDNSNVPYVVAGGGGGNGDGYSGPGLTCCLNGMEASITTTGNASPTPGGSPGGTAGGGGGGSCSGTYVAGGGAGIYGDGQICYAGSAAASYTNGGAGGTGGGSPSSGSGGFGGGGGGYNSGVGNRGGGGGGYSGGGPGYAASSETAAAGGGGGSFVSGSASNPSLAVSSTTGSGRVLVELLCNISLVATGLSANNALCSGNSVTLTTNAVSNYSWSTGATTQSIIISPTSSGIYTIGGTSSAGCYATNAISITVNSAAPSLSIANSATSSICLGKTATLTASGALSYTWTGTSSPTPTNGVSFVPSGTSTYVVTGTNACGTSSAATTITIAPLLVAAATSSSLICSGYNATLTAFSSVNGYTWQPGGQQSSSYIVAPLVNTIYTVTASDGTCVGTATVGINTNPVPTINIVPTNSAICFGSAVSLTATGGSSNNYTWTSVPATTTITGQSSISPSFPTAGAYAFYATGDNNFGCQTTNMQVVIVNAAPNLSVSATKSLVCSSGPSTLNVSGADVYQWDANANNATTQSTTVNPTLTTTYNVTGTLNSTGCPASSMVTVYVYSPTITITSPTSACLGIAVTLTGSVNNPAGGASTTYTWTGPGIPTTVGNNISVTPTSLSIYTLSAKSSTPANNTNLVCIETKTTSVGIAPNPTITVAPSRTYVCKGEPVDLIASGANTFTWNNGAFSGATITVTHNSIATFSYLVMGTDAGGCKNDTVYFLKINGCQGIEAFENNSGISVYPNPNNGEFSIVTDKDMKLQLINELGQVIKTFELNASNQHQVQTADIAKGIYFIVDEKRAMVPQKIIVR